MKNKKARPSIGHTQNIHATCSPDVKSYIKKIGHGNISLGLRILVKFHEQKKKIKSSDNLSSS